MLHYEEARPLCTVSVMAVLYQYISIFPSQTLWPALQQQQEITSAIPGMHWLSSSNAVWAVCSTFIWV